MIRLATGWRRHEPVELESIQQIRYWSLITRTAITQKRLIVELN